MIKQGIKTKLVPFGREHFNKWIEWQRDPENLDFFRLFRFPICMDEAEGFYKQDVYGKFDRKIFIIYSLKEDIPIGAIDIFNIYWPGRNAGLGIIIGEKTYRAKGHAFDALVVICDYIFNRLNLHKVYINVMESNKRLIRFCKKGGFEVEGVLKEEIFQDGQFQDQVHLGLFQKTFQERYRDYFKDPSVSISRRLKGTRGTLNN